MVSGRPAWALRLVILGLAALHHAVTPCASFTTIQLTGGAFTWASVSADISRDGLPDVISCQDNGQYGYAGEGG